jgi:hypothetical protein
MLLPRLHLSPMLHLQQWLRSECGEAPDEL